MHKMVLDRGAERCPGLLLEHNIIGTFDLDKFYFSLAYLSML